MIKTAKELAAACLDVAQNYKTLYVMGCIGAPMNDGNKTKYINHHEYNQRTARKKMIQAATADTFGFDCVCLIKSLLWGWNGDTSASYGGAKYASNGVPDTNANGLIQLCKDVSTDFSTIAVGEVLWMKGHVGIYIGGGLAVECTPSWKNCVQVTAVHNIGKKSGYNGRKWTKHGKLPYVTYDTTQEPTTPATTTEKVETTNHIPVLRKGSKGDTVEALQILLKGYGYDLGTTGPKKDGIDGSFGGKTENAVEAFQEDVGLDADGICGPKTWAKLLGV